MASLFTINLTIIILYVAIAALNDCSSANQSEISFSFAILSNRNSSGYRHVKTLFSTPQSAKSTTRSTGVVRLDVQQRIYTVESRKHVELSSSFVVHEMEPGMPPPGYELMPGLGWYRLHLTPLTWEEARLACEAEGAHLAVLNSQTEADVLKGMYDRAPSTIPGTTWSNLAFIGISDTAEEGTFVTIFGESLQDAGYANWYTGEPNNAKTGVGSEQDCGAIERQSGKLYDVGCRGKAPYFCEYSL